MIRFFFYYTKLSLIIFFTTFLLILFIDFFFGSAILRQLDPYLSKTQFYERLIRIDHPVYHHGFRENVTYNKSKSFNGIFSLCTDNHGFKYHCNKLRGKKFDFAFIGDYYVPKYLLEKHKIITDCRVNAKVIYAGDKWKVIELQEI